MGQSVTSEEIAEAERILRRFGFLRLVEIRAIDRPDGRIDLEVTTRDAWTTKLGLSLGGGGGETRFKVGLEETNVLGYGKEVSFQFEETSVRITKALGYEDPRFLDSDKLLKVVWLDNSDGDGWTASLGLPLLRGADPFGWNVTLSSLTSVVPVYHDGVEASWIRKKATGGSAEVIWTLDGSATETKRLGVGFAPIQEDYRPVVLANPEDLPVDVDRADLYVVARHQQIRFRSESYLNRFSRVEDVSTGLDGEIRIGLSPKLLAGKNDVWLFGGLFGGGFDTFDGNFGTAKIEFELHHGPLESERTGKVDVDAVAYFRNKAWPWHSLGVAHVRYGYGWNIPAPERYTLGGTTVSGASTPTPSTASSSSSRTSSTGSRARRSGSASSRSGRPPSSTPASPPTITSSTRGTGSRAPASGSGSASRARRRTTFSASTSPTRSRAMPRGRGASSTPSGAARRSEPGSFS